MKAWNDMVSSCRGSGGPQVEIAVVGEVHGPSDAYKSIFESLCHGAVAH
jgi:CTP synthase (UTP-ammonia lyase)